VIPPKFGSGRSGDPKFCGFWSGGTNVAPSASIGVVGRLARLMELELSLDHELKLGGSSALLACSNSVLNLSDPSSGAPQPRPVRDGVTGSDPLPLPAALACLLLTTIIFFREFIRTQIFW
jgi:hypothetical protein